VRLRAHFVEAQVHAMAGGSTKVFAAFVARGNSTVDAYGMGLLTSQVLMRLGTMPVPSLAPVE
jgi:hypothetical protein